MKAPTVYRYDGETKEFIGEYKPQPNPMREGEWLLPQFSTLKIAPKNKENCAIVWNGDNWEVIEDHRGETWFDDDDNPIVIKNLGEEKLYKKNHLHKSAINYSLNANSFFQLLLTLGYNSHAIDSLLASDEIKKEIGSQSELDSAIISLKKSPIFYIDNWFLNFILKRDKIPENQIIDLWAWAATIN